MAPMTEASAARAREAQCLSTVGAALWNQDLWVTVVLPKDLADAARSAWERNDEDDIPGETAAQALERSQAGHLALIGIAVAERGTPLEDGSTQVTLHAWQIGAALEAADAQGLLGD